jgi:hypothetical protein
MTAGGEQCESENNSDSAQKWRIDFHAQWVGHATAIVLRTKRLDLKRSVRSAPYRLYAGGFAIAAHRVTQTVVDGLRIEQRIDKRLAVANRQFDC